MMKFAVHFSGPIALRYPRGEAYTGLEDHREPIRYGKAEVLEEGKEIALLAVGNMVKIAVRVRELLKEQGYDVTLVNMRFVKPFDTALVQELSRSHSLLVTMEENIRNGGFGEQVASFVMEEELPARVQIVALPNRFVHQGSVASQMKETGIDADSVAEKVLKKYRRNGSAPEEENGRKAEERLSRTDERAFGRIAGTKRNGPVQRKGEGHDYGRRDSRGRRARGQGRIMFPETVTITQKGRPLPYVSRGGLKLEKAMTHFGLELDGKICMDVGASTGGFTDCMLQNGAAKVYAVDVGHGQLDWKLRNDERVVCMERTNIRYVTPEDIQEPVQFVSIDVSFISLTKVLLPVRGLMEENAQMTALIKPQFEAGREKVGKKGVVRDPAVHLEVIWQVIRYAQSISFGVRHLEFSPIKGPEGNIEYLIHLVRLPDGVTEEDVPVQPEEVVRQAHDTLDKQ